MQRFFQEWGKTLLFPRSFRGVSFPPSHWLSSVSVLPQRFSLSLFGSLDRSFFVPTASILSLVSLGAFTASSLFLGRLTALSLSQRFPMSHWSTLALSQRPLFLFPFFVLAFATYATFIGQSRCSFPSKGWIILTLSSDWLVDSEGRSRMERRRSALTLS